MPKRENSLVAQLRQGKPVEVEELGELEALIAEIPGLAWVSRPGSAGWTVHPPKGETGDAE